MSKLSATCLQKSYRNRCVVKDVSLTVNAGEIVGLLGPNGAGKTTCFYMITGFIQADSGQVTLDGIDLSNKAMHTRARAGIGYLPQEASVFRKLSVEDNIQAILDFRQDLSADEKTQKRDQLIQEFHLDHVRGTQGMSLSGGERRRCEIARALATEPKFILLDEPFAGVDPISVEDIKKIIRQLSDRGIGVLITDHNVRDTLTICERAYIVGSGEVIAEGNADDIINNKTVRDVYLGESFSI